MIDWLRDKIGGIGSPEVRMEHRLLTANDDTGGWTRATNMRNEPISVPQNAIPSWEEIDSEYQLDPGRYALVRFYIDEDNGRVLKRVELWQEEITIDDEATGTQGTTQDLNQWRR